MNPAQIVISIGGVILLGIGPLLLRRRLGRMIMFPRSLALQLVTMAFFPLLMVLWIDWFIIMFAAGQGRTVWRAIVDGGAALVQLPLGVTFGVMYMFSALIGLAAYFVSRQGERGGNEFATSRGLQFRKNGGSFRLSPPLGSTELQRQDMVKLSTDSFIAAFTSEGSALGPGRTFRFLSLAVGPIVNESLSGTMPRTASSHEGAGVIRAGDVTCVVPPNEADQWQGILDALVAADPEFNLGAVAAHEGRITMTAGRLASKQDYERMAALLDAAARAPCAISASASRRAPL